jgi:putative addiction module component (TIGR02574 family)
VQDAALKLPAEERVALAEALWESLEHEPLPDWQKRVLDDRLDEMRQHPERWVTWDEVEESVRSRLGRRASGG